MDDIFCRRSEKEEDVLWESNSFYVMLGVGLFAHGHVMIIPKDHYDAYGELPGNLDQEFAEVRQRVHKVITQEFSEPFWAEYGFEPTVPHAHIHGIPSIGPDYHIDDIIDALFPKDLEIEQCTFSRIKEIYETEGRYILIEQRGIMYAAHVPQLPGMRDKLGMRRFFANITGRQELSSWQALMNNPNLQVRDERLRSETRSRLATLWKRV